MRPIRVLYISHNEVDNGLVRSQVLPYLRGLGARGMHVWLLTYERGGPFPEGEFPRDRWTGIRARPGSGLPSKAIDIVVGSAVAGLLALRHRVDLVHARSYLPAAVGWVLRLLIGRPYVFDMRGFLGEEYVDVGYWTRQDPRYRTLRRAERHLLARASAVVVPSRGAEEALRQGRFGSMVSAPVIVQPAMVDLQRFRPPRARGPIPTLVYSGSLGLWYQLDEMLRVFAYARELVRSLRFLIITREDPRLVADAVACVGLPSTAVAVRAAGYDEVPGLLEQAHVAIALVRQVPSKIAAGPLKIGEYLACGLPVVLNAMLGDADALVARYGAGHVVPSVSDDDLRVAGQAVARLIVDEDARRRARALAEAEFDLDRGVQRYAELYERIAARP